MGSKSGGSTTTVQKADPWSGQQGYLTDIFANASRLYYDPSMAAKYYPGQTIADQSPETMLSQNLTANRALMGSPVTNSARGYLTGMLSGDYLNSNPHLDATFNKAADQVQARVNSAFSGGGRFGGGLNQRVLGDSLSGLATDIYGGNYDQERNRMQQGLLFAPQMANQDYYDLGQLANVGMQKEGRAQDLINSDIARYNFERDAPWNQLANYNSMIQGNFGGTSTSTQPYYQNRGAGILGGALGGLQMGLQSGAGGIPGMLLGGGLGLLGGLF